MSRFSLNFLLARRILKDKGDRFSRPIVYLSVGGVSLGLVIMMIAIGVTSGYKQEIRNKVIAMGSHIRITHYDQNYSFEQVPINQHSDCILQLKNNPDVVEVQNFATKVGIIKTDDQVEGVVLKGVDETFSWDFFQKNIIQGEGFSTTDTTASNSIIVSKRMADKLRLKWATRCTPILCRTRLASAVSRFQASMRQDCPNTTTCLRWWTCVMCASSTIGTTVW